MALISFLGPKGTFTHEAASMLGDDLVSYCTIPAVMESVANNETEYGIVPIENSIEGPVGITLDSLAHKFDLKIYGEIIIPINQNLIVNPGCSLEDIKDVYSHSQAISQCQEFITQNRIQPHYAVSTANAAKSIIGDRSKAAIGNRKAAELYGLEILKANIQDTDNNETRFVVVSNEDHEPTGNDKTSIIFSIYEDRPGELYKILGIFQKHNINLTKIESRPIAGSRFEYLFYLDFTGNVHSEDAVGLICQLSDEMPGFSFLGNYSEL